jgi:hypothetical protein
VTDTNVFALVQPGTFTDRLTDVLRDGARTALAMIFKLAQAAEKSWRRLKGYSLLPKVILGVKFMRFTGRTARTMQPRWQVAHYQALVG